MFGAERANLGAAQSFSSSPASESSVKAGKHKAQFAGSGYLEEGFHGFTPADPGAEEAASLAHER